MPGLIDHQHRASITQVVDHVAAQLIADAFAVPNRARQQMLHPIRTGVPGMLSDRPAVHPRQSGHQPQKERPDSSPRLHPPESATDPGHQFIEPDLPPKRIITLYAVARSHRAIFLRPHSQDPRAVALSQCLTTRQASLHATDR